MTSSGHESFLDWATSRELALPIGMQVLAPRHRDALLFDVALSVERERPWPLVAPRTERATADRS